MKFQFSVRFLLLITAILAVWLGTLLALPSLFSYFAPGIFSGYDLPLGLLMEVVFCAPVWMPLVVLAYAIGRRTLTVWTLVAVIVIELLGAVVCIGPSWLMLR